MIHSRREKLEEIIMISMVTVFMGQIYLSPVTGWFRLSMAVMTISMLLLYFKDVSAVGVSFLVALIIPVFRAFVHYVSNADAPFSDILLNYMPVAIFYILFGIFFDLFQVRGKTGNPVFFIISLWFCDSAANIAEVSYRSALSSFDFSTAVHEIIVIGFIRSALTYSFYVSSIYYKNRYDRSKKEERYKEMLLFISSLKSEIFFLRKSMNDIENAMEMSYSLYRQINSTDLKDKALTVAKNIHEIKKDYYRVVDGMEKVLSEENKSSSMKLSEIFAIMQANAKKTIQSGKKDIEIEFKYLEDFSTNEFYPLISIMNNIITNAIDAIEKNGRISVIESSNPEFFIFSVIDNGCGIDEENMDVLFEPGFSTKYDPATGRMSTGIGLSHVKEIVRTCFKGEVTAFVGNGENRTRFEVKLPKEYVVARGE